MIVSNPALCDKIEFVDEKYGRREFFRQVKNTIDILGGLTKKLRGDHGKADLKDGHVHGPGHGKGKRCLSCTRWPDKEKFSDFIDPVTFEEIPMDDCMLDLSDYC